MACLLHRHIQPHDNYVHAFDPSSIFTRSGHDRHGTQQQRHAVIVMLEQQSWVALQSRCQCLGAHPSTGYA